MKKGLKKRINHAVGKSMQDYAMISDNDRILLGLSGGIDSQVLLHILFLFQKKAPVNFDIVPVHIDPGFKGALIDELASHVRQYCTPLHVENTDYGVIAHSEKNRENPCFLCSRLRRKRLFEIAQEKNCSKIALGHNKDDLIETLFINIFYAGKIGTMRPRQSFFGGAIDIIRPLSYVEKNEIEAFGRRLDLPQFENNCPSAGKTKRSEVKQMLEVLYDKNEHIKGNIFRAMGNVAADYLLDN